MTHPAAWTCRACGTLLGYVRDGVLRPCVPVECVDGAGVARVRCPGCGRVRAWAPSVAGAAVARRRRPPDRAG